MNMFVALAIGYVVGAKTGGKNLGQLGRSVKALCLTDEFADVVSATRAQIGNTLRDLASMVDGGHPVAETGGDPAAETGGDPAAETGGDLVARVRRLVGDG
jgi:hypothetical protein